MKNNKMKDETEKRTRDVLEKAKRLAARSWQIERVIGNIRLMKEPTDAELRIINRNKEIMPRDKYVSQIYNVTGKVLEWGCGGSSIEQITYLLAKKGCKLSQALLECADYYWYTKHITPQWSLDKGLGRKILARRIGEQEYEEYLTGQKPVAKFLDIEYFLPKDEEERRTRLTEVQRIKERNAEYDRKHPHIWRFVKR